MLLDYFYHVIYKLSINPIWPLTATISHHIRFPIKQKTRACANEHFKAYVFLFIFCVVGKVINEYFGAGDDDILGVIYTGSVKPPNRMLVQLYKLMTWLTWFTL